MYASTEMGSFSTVLYVLSTEVGYSLVQVVSCQPFPEKPHGFFGLYQASHAGSILSRTPLHRSNPILPNCLNSLYLPTRHKSLHHTSDRLTETYIRATCLRSSLTDHIYTVAETTTGSRAMIRIVPMQSLYSLNVLLLQRSRGLIIFFLLLQGY